MDENMDNSPQSKYNESKAGIGVVLGLFLGIIGLIIGICIYPEGTVARKTFIKAWAWTRDSGSGSCDCDNLLF